MQKSERLASRRWVSVVLIFVAYALLSPVTFAALILFQPAKPDPVRYASAKRAFGVEAKDVTISAPSGQKLHAWLFRKPGAKFIALISHGQGGNVSTHVGLAATFVSIGCSALIYDYEGFGESGGKASLQAMLSDGQAAYTFLRDNEHFKPQQIIDCGVSLGSGVAANIAEHNPCSAVILISPFNSLRAVACERFPHFKFYPDALFPQPDLGADAFCKSNKNTPTLFVHGALDTTILARNAQELYDEAGCPKELIIKPNAHHGDFSTQFLAETIKSFLQKHRIG